MCAEGSGERLTAVSEAVTNAIIHGYQQEIHKIIIEATEAEVLPEEWAKATGANKGYEVLVDVQDKKDILHYGMDVLVVVK